MSDLIEVPITGQMIADAKEEADTFKDNLKNSAVNGELTYIGLLGEMLCKTAIWKFKGPSTYDYDVTLNGSKWDVKSKRRSVLPRMDYSVSVCNLNGRQKCDYYIFTSVCLGKMVGHVLGYYPSDLFWRDCAMINKRGGDGDNGFSALATTYNMFVGDLYSATELRDKWKPI